MSIRGRIFLVIIALFSIGFYFPIDFIVDDIEMRYRESTEEPLVDSARVLAAIAASTAEQGQINIPLFRRSFEAVHGQTFSARIFDLVKTRVDLHVYITDRDGIVLFDSADGQDEGRDYSAWRDVYLTLHDEYGARTSSIENEKKRKMLYIASPIFSGDQLIGVLTVGKPTHSSDQFVRAAQDKLITGGIVLCLTLIAIGLLLGVWVTRPIKRLTDYARAVRDGRRIERPALESSEMEELGAAFEQMRDALNGKSYVENYVQTLTHEIKSPLSAIRGAVELLGEELSVPQRRSFLRNIQQESERIGRIIDNLLLLSGLESRQCLNAAETFAVHPLLEELGQALSSQLLVKDLDMQIDGDVDGTMQGEANLVRQALLNLLQNAIDFSPAGAVIELSVQCSQSGTRFTVIDQGPGVPDYARERIFERFYSLQRPGNGRKSSGLGLSLVREIAALHQGRISLENGGRGGTIAQLFFPNLRH